MAKCFRYEIPSELIKHVTALCGESGVEWLRTLPDLICEVEANWNLTVGEPFVKGEFNFVAAADWDDGREAVLALVALKEALEDPARLLLEV